jgi:hypothetical protein
VSRPDLTAAAREANETGFDMLIACAFNFDAHSSELDRLGPLRIVKARMNPDLHMADELKNTGKGNLFVVFGEPDIDVETLDTAELQVTVKGVDVYDPNTGEIRSNDVRDIAAWFIDTDYASAACEEVSILVIPCAFTSPRCDFPASGRSPRFAVSILISNCATAPRRTEIRQKRGVWRNPLEPRQPRAQKSRLSGGTPANRLNAARRDICQACISDISASLRSAISLPTM